MAINYVERARALVGTRFRPQGRGADGLDCIGVVLATFGIDPGTVGRDYRMEAQEPIELDTALLKHFRRLSVRQLAPGDIMLMTVAGRQLHLGVRTAGGFVHAHAGLRRVVETPGMPEWPLIAAYRRRVRARSL
ncbi:MAG TPA: peptidoglycan endopeptidase [Sphingomicrobium sp.]|nr:peptidoglycan endopeptidase [Sphingomicrobium sp.]